MDLENKPTFCVTRKRKIDKAKADEFLRASADSDDDEEDLKRVFDWMDPIAVKRTAIALEDRNAKRMRLKEEGSICKACSRILSQLCSVNAMVVPGVCKDDCLIREIYCYILSR